MAYSPTLITLAEVKANSNISLTTTDAFINSLIPNVTAAVENYCRRRFGKYTWAQWFPVNQEIMLPEWPINTVLYVGIPITAAKITDVNGTNSNYTFTITQPNSRSLNIQGKFTVINSTTLVATDFLFSTYTTLGALKTAVEGATAGVTFAYDTAYGFNYANINTQTLRSGSGLTIRCGYNVFTLNGIQLDQVYRLSDTSDRLIFNPNMCQTSGLYSYGFGQYSTGYANIDSTEPLDWIQTEDCLVVWDGGYATTDVPMELKWILSSIIRDILSLYDADSTGQYKGIYDSESLGDYSYRLGANAKFPEIIERYSKQLDLFKRKVIA